MPDPGKNDWMEDWVRDFADAEARLMKTMNFGNLCGKECYTWASGCETCKDAARSALAELGKLSFIARRRLEFPESM